MAKKIVNRLTNNIGLKLFSIVLAVILWLVVVNIDNPQTTITFTSTAAITNESIITDNGKVYEILDDSNSVRFSVTGPRTIVEGMSASDFTIVADMNKIDLDLGLIPVEVTADRYSSKVSISLKTTNVHVSIESLKTQQFAITATANGTPMEGYALGNVTCDPATVTISGPESVIAKIEKVNAEINVDGMYSNRTQTVVPVIYDDENSKITSSNITIEPSTVQAAAQILETKSVNISYEYQGKLKDGYTIESVVSLPETVDIKGSKEVLADINKIVIPSNEIDLSDVVSTIEKKITLSTFLPEGVELVNPEQNTVVIKIEVSGNGAKEFTIDASKIKIKDLPAGYEYEMRQETVKVVLKGDKERLKKVKESDVVLSLSFKGVEEGNFSLTPTAKDIEGVDSVVVSTVSGKLSNKNEGDGDPDSE